MLLSSSVTVGACLVKEEQTATCQPSHPTSMQAVDAADTPAAPAANAAAPSSGAAAQTIDRSAFFTAAYRPLVYWANFPMLAPARARTPRL